MQLHNAAAALLNPEKQGLSENIGAGLGHLLSALFFQMSFFFFYVPASFLFILFFIFPLGFSLFLWPWQESLAAVFQHPQAGSGKEGQPSYIRNHRFMAFTRSWGVNADQMENTPARALQLLALPHARAQSLILIVRPKGNSVCSPNALQLSRWSSISFLKFPSWSIVCK